MPPGRDCTAMSRARTLSVATGDADIRLDRWFKRHYPALGHGRLEKLLRTGQVRLDGARVKASARLAAGQRIRVPPGLIDRPVRAERLDEAERKFIQSLVLYRDARIVAIDKPAGLAVQGGTGVGKSVDALLEGLRFGTAERPRLVHRLDKATSGVLLIARDRKAAAALVGAFRDGLIVKEYWGLVAGVPRPERGTLDLALVKKPVDPAGREQVTTDEADGKPARTDYAVIDSVSDVVSWLSLVPRTGRTHQLRVHCRALGAPILGDRKYGDPHRPPDGRPAVGRLMLHARRVYIPRDAGGPVTVCAPLDAAMRAQWSFYGFAEEAGRDIDSFTAGGPV